MAESKTEQPTQKRLRDAAKKGQVFKARDFITLLTLLVGSVYLAFVFSLKPLEQIYVELYQHAFILPLHDYVRLILTTFLKLSLPLVFICVLVHALPSLILSKFQLATEALKPDLKKLDPIAGAKKIFNIRSLKELIRALLYLLLMAAMMQVFWNNKKIAIVALAHHDLTYIIKKAPTLVFSFLMLAFACFVVICLFDALVEFFLHIKQLKMDKSEVKREHKEQEGNPEIKHKRRELHQELLSEQVRSDIRQSNFMLANPTHIAIGIYINAELSPYPLVSVLESNQRALAALAYARQCGVPVVRDVPLARKLFRKARRYALVPFDELEGIASVLQWLVQVELAGQSAFARASDAEASVERQ